MAYPYYNYQQQPYYGQMQQPQQAASVVWLNSETDVVGYPVTPGSAVILCLMSGDAIYRKTADATGRPSIEVYRRDAARPETEYVTRGEFNELLQRLKEGKNNE